MTRMRRHKPDGEELRLRVDMSCSGEEEGVGKAVIDAGAA